MILMTPATMSSQLNLLSLLLTDAVDERLTPFNPVRRQTRASARTIALPPFLVELSREHLARHPYGFVFATPSRKWLWRSKFLRRVFRPGRGWHRLADSERVLGPEHPTTRAIRSSLN